MTLSCYGILTAHGISPEAFWEMSWGEVRTVADALGKRRNDETRFQAATAYNMAKLTVLGVSNLLSKNRQHYPSLQEAFPGLFDDVEFEQDWRLMRAKFHESFPRQK